MGRIEKMVAVVICCILISVASASAQEVYPNKPIQIIVPMAAGGSLDLICRILAEKFREYLGGQPVLVVNKPGASQAIAATFVATSRPDGYNLYAASGPALGLLHILNPNFAHGLNDLTSIAAFAKYPLVIVVNKDLAVKTLEELVTYAKKNPGSLTCGNTGYGASDHLTFELFKLIANIPTGDIPIIPYPGVTPAITALLSNQVQLAILPFSALVAKQIESGGIRALVVTSPKRFSFRPEVPTIVEAGFQEAVKAPSYLGFWVPAKTPGSIVKRLEEATKRVTEDKEAREKIEGMYHEVEFLNSQDLRKYVEGEVVKYGPLIKKFNITIK